MDRKQQRSSLLKSKSRKEKQGKINICKAIDTIEHDTGRASKKRKGFELNAPRPPNLCDPSLGGPTHFAGLIVDKKDSQHVRPARIMKSHYRENKQARTSTGSSDPSLDFYFDILNWNIKSTLPVINEVQEQEADIVVPDSFESYEQYFSVWKPLAVKEIHAQTIQNLTPSKSVRVTALWDKTQHGRIIDMMLRIVPTPGERADPFLYDLLLISTEHNYLNRRDIDSSKGVLGIVTNQSSLKIKVLYKHWMGLQYNGGAIYMTKVNNLLTAMREFSALVKCRHYPLLPQILSGRHASGSLRLDTLGNHYVQYLESHFNESQQNAIKAAATTLGFTLIVGPPGTGKTTTLKGLLNSLHLREYNRYYNAILDVAKKPDAETAKAWSEIGNEKPHILVTAPSNIAVDNVVSKIMEEGFCDGQGRRYFPSIVRVGSGTSAALRGVSLDQFIEDILKKTIDEIDRILKQLRRERQQVEHDSIIIRAELRKMVEWVELQELSNKTPSICGTPPPPSPSVSESAGNPCDSPDPCPPIIVTGNHAVTTPPPPPSQVDEWKTPCIEEFPMYLNLAQKLNACLERLQQLNLEVERYEFVRNQKFKGCHFKTDTASKAYLESSFLTEAHIVFTTLSSAGLRALDSSLNFEVLVVDEACQAVELSNLIPMKFGSKQCVLVGDPRQLSATTFNRRSSQSRYERSLFERLEACNHPVNYLKTQYRSHPMISKFPRNYFYSGMVTDGENVLTSSYTKPYQSLSPAFKPLTFFNLVNSTESSGGKGSRRNEKEAKLTLNLFLTLKQSCEANIICGKVGIITPYSDQQALLKQKFRKELGSKFEKEVEINTVDGFQGREKDIIILSTVRADPSKGVGFLNDRRRMNVALTRAKYACFVIGSESALSSSRPWCDFLRHIWNENAMVMVENECGNLLELKNCADGGLDKPINIY